MYILFIHLLKYSTDSGCQRCKQYVPVSIYCKWDQFPYGLHINTCKHVRAHERAPSESRPTVSVFGSPGADRAIHP